MAWQALAGGANGLLWYSAHHIFKCSPPDEVEMNWGNLVKVAEEVKSYADVMLSDDAAVASLNPSVSVRAFRKDGETWVLAVNSSDRPLDAKLDLSGKFSSATAAFGPVPQLADGTRLSLALKPLEPALVRMR